MNHVSEVWLQFEEKNGPRLLQLRVFRLGLLQNGDVGVGVFPEDEEILLGSFRFVLVATHHIGSPKLETSQRSQISVAVAKRSQLLKLNLAFA